MLSESAFTTSIDEVRQIMQDTMNLELEFRAWATDQPALWQPAKIGKLGNRVGNLPFGFSENVETYFDCKLYRCYYSSYPTSGLDLTFGSLRRSRVEHLPQNASFIARRGVQVSEAARRLHSTRQAAPSRE